MKPEPPAIRWSMVNSAPSELTIEITSVAQVGAWKMLPARWSGCLLPCHAMPWVVASCGPCQGHVGHVLVPWWIKSLSILRLLENGFPHYPNQWVEVHTPTGTSIIHAYII